MAIRLNLCGHAFVSHGPIPSIATPDMRTELRHVSSRGSVAAAPEPARCRDGLTGSQGTTRGFTDMTIMRPRNARDLLLTLCFALIPATTLADGLRLVAEGESQDFGFSVAPAGDV